MGILDLRHWYNAVYADTRYVQRHGNIVSKRYPTQAPGTCPVSLAGKLSRCQEGMAQFLQVPAN